MPPSFSGGLLCAIAPVAATASAKAKTPERTRFMKPPFRHAALFCGLYFDWLDHAACACQRQAARRSRHRLISSPCVGRVGAARRKTFAGSGDTKAFSAKRNDGLREA